MSTTKKVVRNSFLLLVLLILQAGCASTQRTSTTLPEQAITITFTPQYGVDPGYQSLIDAFEAQHPNIHVQPIPPQEDLPSLETLASQVDTILLGTALGPQDSRLVLDLSPLMTGSAFDASAFWPDALAGCQAGDAQKGLPVSLNPSLILYNKALFDQAGIAYPQPGWTWEDFQDDVQALADPQATPPIYGFLDTPTHPLLSPLIAATLANGASQAQAAVAWQWFVDLAHQGSFAPDDTTQNQDEATALIRSGQVALWMGGLLSQEVNGQGADFSTGVAPFPLGAEGDQTTIVSPTCAVISAGTRQPAASWAWLSYLSQNLLPPSGSYALPADRQATETGETWQSLPAESVAAVRYGLEHGWYGWINSDFSPVKAAIDQAILTGADLAGLLPQGLSNESVKVALPTAGSTPVAVSPPTSTPGTPLVSKPANVPSAVYYADPQMHVSQEAVQQLANAFNRANPDMYIEIATERTDFQSGFYSMYDATHFDCFAEQGGSLSLPTWISDPTGELDFAGKLLPLDPLLDANTSAWLDNLNPTLLDASRLNGSLYGLPVALRPYLVYYNADLLKSLGLKDPSPDWTPQEFWALATQAAALKTGVYGYAPGWIFPWDFLSDAQLLGPTQTYPNAAFNTPEMIGLLQQLQDLVEQGALFPLDTGGTHSAHGNNAYGDQLILSGKVLMWISQTGPIVMGREPNFEVKVATMPFDQTLSPGDSISLYITNRAQNPQVCWAWFKYMQEQPVNLFQGIPAQRSVLYSEGWAATAGEETAAVYRSAMEKLKVGPDAFLIPPTPLILWWNDALVSVYLAAPGLPLNSDSMLQWREDALASGYQGEDPVTALQKIQFKAQAMLDCMEAAGVSPVSASETMYSTAEACAHQVDPDYRSQSELSQTGNSPWK